MPRTLMTVQQVAQCLHVSAREVIRMAEQGILPARRVRAAWQFRTGEIWNWIEANLHALPARREKDRHPADASQEMLASVLQAGAVRVNLLAKTRASVLRELVALAEHVDPSVDRHQLWLAVKEREDAGSTALQDGVAVPHPARPFYSHGPLITAIRTAEGIVFGQRDGGLTDLFILVCCPDQTEHLLLLGRLCRLLIDKGVQAALRAAPDADAFTEALLSAERRVCGES